MKAGDIVALYSGSFRLAVAIDAKNLVVIYSSNQVIYKSIELLIRNINDLSTIKSTEALPENLYEI